MIFKGGYINNSDSVRAHKIKNIHINCNELTILVVSSITILINNNIIYRISLSDICDTKTDNTILIQTKIIDTCKIGLFVNNKNIYVNGSLFEYDVNIYINSNKDSKKNDIITYSEDIFYDS